jgi:preprotein translocase subunit YajC
MMTTINELINHPTMHKGDRVLLMSGKEGEILERFDMKLNTYRIRVVENNEIVYFDETKLKLKRKHILNVLLGR